MYIVDNHKFLEIGYSYIKICLVMNGRMSHCKTAYMFLKMNLALREITNDKF